MCGGSGGGALQQPLVRGGRHWSGVAAAGQPPRKRALSGFQTVFTAAETQVRPDRARAAGREGAHQGHDAGPARRWDWGGLLGSIQPLRAPINGMIERRRPWLCAAPCCLWELRLGGC